MTLSDLLIPFFCLFGSSILIGGIFLCIIISHRIKADKDWPGFEIKEKLLLIWAYTWRILAALLVQSFVRVKITDKKIDRRWCIKKCENKWPETVSVRYKYKGRWYSPITWIIIIVAMFVYIFKDGLIEFWNDFKDVFKYGEERNYSWTYKENYECSKLRLWFDSFVLIRVEEN